MSGIIFIGWSLLERGLTTSVSLCRQKVEISSKRYWRDEMVRKDIRRELWIYDDAISQACANGASWSRSYGTGLFTELNRFV